MLNLEALTSTTDLVALLADKGVSLRPMGDTPLAEAMAATKTWNQKLGCLSEIDKLPADLYQQNEVRVSGGEAVDDMHTAYMEAASKELGIQLASHVAHATTVVLPVIGDLHDAIKAAQNLDERCGIRSFKVEMVSGSPLLDVADIVSQIDKFEKLSPVRELPFQLDFKPLSDEQIVDLMKVGAETYDNAVSAFVSQSGMELIREVWNVVFCGEKSGFAHYDMFRADRVKGLPRNFATFLIASKLLMDLDNMPEVTGLGRLSSNKYAMVLKNLQETAGGALYTQLMIQRGMEKTGKLIDKVDGKTVYVNKPVFDRFMAEGGDIETILGSVVSGFKKFYVNEIVADVEKFKHAWAIHTTQAKLNASSSELMDVRRCIDVFVRQYVRTTDDMVVIANRENIIENCRSYLEGVYAPALKEVDILAMKVVCEVIFNHTDALQILMGVNEAMSANPDITKEDALYLSMTNYVAGWFASQVEIDQ